MYDKDFENNPEILKKPGEREVPPDQDFAKAFENEEESLDNKNSEAEKPEELTEEEKIVEIFGNEEQINKAA